MYSIILMNQFLGWGLSNFLGFKLGSSGMIILGVYFCMTSFLLSCLAFIDVGIFENVMISKYWNFLVIYYLNINFGMLLDSITVMMLLVVTGITFLVYLFSIDYMQNDRHMASFLSYLSLFSFFMLMLITAPNYLQMFFGWEGVGLASYLLINFWNTSLAANKASFKAIIFNSMGDYCLSMAMCLFQIYFGSLNYSIMNSIIGLMVFQDQFAMSFIISLLFMAACGKSSQLGLHFWLRDAMEGPTRVSALIHAATMVTAGIYLLISSSPILDFVRKILVLIAMVGGLTAMVSALMGLIQTDIKKVMAFSTCSQLGYMVLSCGLSLYEVSLFHLVTHAMFKALLFLSAGSVIHSLYNEQNLLQFGNLIKFLRFTYMCMLTGSLALGGFRFLAGFYSKDTILELLATNLSPWVLSLWYLDTFAAVLTCVYSTSLILLVFFLKRSYNYLLNKSQIYESSNLVCIVFMPLLLLSMILGYLGQNMFMGVGNSFWNNAMFMNIFNFYPNLDFHWNSMIVKLLPTLLSFVGIFMAIFCMLLSMNNSYLQFRKSMYSWFECSFYLDSMVISLTWFFLLLSQKMTFQLMDKGLLDMIGPTGLSYVPKLFLNSFKMYFSGNIYQYIVLMVLSIILSLIVCIV